MLQNHIRDGKSLKPDDIDQIEVELFQRLGNTSKNIALDAFHSRLVPNAHIKRTGLDKFGVPIESIDNSFEKTAPASPNNNARAQTSN